MYLSIGIVILLLLLSVVAFAARKRYAVKKVCTMSPAEKCEALNLLINGYIAVDIAASSSIKSSILPGAKVYITPAGVLTLTADSNVDTGYVCTGLFDIVEENASGSNYEYVIEICKI